MLQTKDFDPTQDLHGCQTCANCPMFLNWQGTRNRGWCSAFSKMARTYHPHTHDCELALKQHQEENPIEVQVTLCSHELGVDPDDGHIFAKEQRVISLVVPEITRKAVMKAFEKCLDQFKGFYVLDFNRCYGSDAEF